MKPFYQRVRRNWIGIVLSVVLAATFFGLGYGLGRRSLRAQITALTAQLGHQGRLPVAPWAGASPMRSAQAFAPGASVPANASPEMKEFLENRAKLSALFAQMRSQAGSNGAPNPQAFAQFREQNKALLDRQHELAQIIGREQAQNPLPTPPPLQMPANASPQMAAFLTARDQLMRDQVAFMNQHRSDDPATRQAAMQQWRQQNAGRFQQLQQEAQAMAQHPLSTPTTPVIPTSTNSTNK